MKEGAAGNNKEKARSNKQALIIICKSAQPAYRQAGPRSIPIHTQKLDPHDLQLFPVIVVIAQLFLRYL
jgi:hypothetical protein